MKIEKGKFYSIHYKAALGSCMGSGECIEAWENGLEGRFKLPDGNTAIFYSQDIVCEMNPYKLEGTPKVVGRTE
jgi:hypothetical protein